MTCAALITAGLIAGAGIAGATDSSVPPTTGATTAAPSTTTASGPSTTVPPVELPSDPNAVILVLRHTGGFAPMDALVRFGPVMVITAAGDVYTTNNAETDPTPLVTPVVQRKLDAEGMRALVAYLAAEGMYSTPPDYNDPMPQVMDAPNTTLYLYVADHAVVHDAYALGIGNPDGPETAPARKHFQEVLAKLGDLAAVVGAEHLTEQTFRPTGYQMVAGEVNLADYTSDPTFEPDLRDWPAASGVTLAEANPCVPLAAEWGDKLFGSATTSTFFKQDGKLYRVGARPLVAGEKACEGFLKS